MSANATLGHGTFYGDYRERRQVGDLAIADLRPTVPEHDVETHTHDDAHFLLLLDGLYLSSAKGMPAVCNTRALVLNPPGTKHRDCFRGLDGRFFTLSIPAHLWRSAADQRALPEHALQLSPSGLVQATGLWRELRGWDSASPLVIEDGVEALLDAATLMQRVMHRDGPAWLERAREQLEDDWEHTPRLSALACNADVHPVYFSRAFRRRFGCSPGEYLRHCRMERAIGLLHDPHMGLAQVAVACGFVDQSHFTHAFRRHYRCTPAQYRALA
ncbi:helix-turn-helix transcriptional regulator [Montanilutibacter psychrotolerans]|uniref:helix-turn-helix transcriptional regulator n=1 Tax=Montanilutibacter psychrotolerans TaxID=1327343 RepID=UPI000F4266C9|nr:AraC family transcriptional regulator [Lysobacter psychrotolerans]